MKQTIIISCTTFLLGILCTQAFHAAVDHSLEDHYLFNQQEKTNIPSVQNTHRKEITTYHYSPTASETITPIASSNIVTTPNQRETPAQEHNDKMQQEVKVSDQVQEQIKNTQGLLQYSQNETDRLSTLDSLFEKTEADHSNDPARALTLSNFFRDDKQLAAYIPQSIQCHANNCKIELPISDQTQASQMLDTLSAKLRTQDLQASHIFAANNAAKGTTQLYISLLETPNNL